MSNFVVSVSEEVFYSGLSSKELTLFSWICKYSRRDGFCFVKEKIFCDYRYLKALKNSGFVRIEKKGPHSPSHYFPTGDFFKLRYEKYQSRLLNKPTLRMDKTPKKTMVLEIFL